ncbi:MAG: hypothetical protein ACR2KV_00030 [Solirubrobacteraceae bacterium]
MSTVALDKLGARGISAEETEQLPRNAHVTVRNPSGSGGRVRRLLPIGRTDGDRTLTRDRVDRRSLDLVARDGLELD